MADDFDISRIDDVIHGRIRLGIMAYLSGAGTADFTSLKARLQTTDGNLSVHLRKLEEAGFVAVTKSFRGPKALDGGQSDRRRAHRLRGLSGCDVGSAAHAIKTG